MRLRRAVSLAMVSIIYAFGLRTVGTFWPDLFRNITAAHVVHVASLCASLAFILFYLFFYRDYVKNDPVSLRRATLAALVASVAVSLLHLKRLLNLVEAFPSGLYETSPFLFRLIRSHGAGALVSWVASLLVLYFFVVFHGESVRRGTARLRRATLSAVIGTCIGTAFLTITLLSYAFSSPVAWSTGLLRTLSFIMLPVSAIGFACLLYFYTVFRGELTS
jgi:hypothetical protein